MKSVDRDDDTETVVAEILCYVRDIVVVDPDVVTSDAGCDSSDL